MTNNGCCRSVSCHRSLVISYMFLDTILNLIFPSLCLNCRNNVKSGDVVCDKCFEAIPINQTLFCGKCRARLPDGKKICHKDSKFILGSASGYDNDAVKNLIHGLKFQYLRSAAAPLGELIIRYFTNLKLSTFNFTVIPLPLSSERLRKRGFNQSELIAEVFARHFSLPMDKNCLTRIKNTKPQSDTKNLRERRENVSGCFAVKNPEAACGEPRRTVRGGNIILIDDVITSGATVSEAASALKSAGAKKVLVLTAAKA